MDGIEIQPVPVKAGAAGQTYEWCTNVPGLQITFFVRNAGTISGNHFHLGEDPSKRPERFILLAGEATFIACDGTQLLEASLSPFTEVLISPRIAHALHAKTSILFAEYRQTIYDREHSDTFGADLYRDQLTRDRIPIIESALTNYTMHVSELMRARMLSI